MSELTLATTAPKAEIDQPQLDSIDAFHNDIGREPGSLARYLIATAENPTGGSHQLDGKAPSIINDITEGLQATREAITPPRLALVGATTIAALAPGLAQAKQDSIRAVSASAAQEKVTWYEKHCLPTRLAINVGVRGFKRQDSRTNASITTPRNLEQGEKRVVTVRYNTKKYTHCGSIVGRVLGDKYFPTLSTSSTAEGKFVKTKTGGFIRDIYSYQEAKGRDIQSVVVWLKNKR